MLLKEDYIKKFKRCIMEYTDASGAFGLEEDDNDAPMDMPADGGEAPMGGAPADGGAPMGGDAPMGGGEAPMGGTPMNGGAAAPEGFAPQGIDTNAGLDGMGSEQPQASAPSVEDEVIDVDDLTDSQEETEKKVEELSSKFEKLLGSLDGIEKRISDIDSHTNDYLNSLKVEIEKRNPSPLQRMTMRSTKSTPYGITPNEYMNNYAPENYTDESDNNGADDPQYKITKDDIDNFTDYSSIAREFDGKMGLHDLIGI